MNINKQKLTIEEKLLRKAGFSAAKTEEVIRERYSMAGSQKPILVLTPYESKEAPWVPKPESKTVKKTQKQKKLNEKKPRVALQAFISTARANQKVVKGVMDRAYRSAYGATAGGKEPGPLTVSAKELRAWKAVPKYDDFASLSKLWNGYVVDLLMLKGGSAGSGAVVNASQKMNFAQKLASADFNGAKITVIEATSPSIVGLSGIVLWEAKSNFVIITKGGKCYERMDELETVDIENPGAETAMGGIKIVDKVGTRFRVEIEIGKEVMDFEIIGSRFLFRTADRSGKKFKPKNVDLI